MYHIYIYINKAEVFGYEIEDIICYESSEDPHLTCDHVGAEYYRDTSQMLNSLVILISAITLFI